MMTAPVGVLSDIGYSGNTRQPLGLHKLEELLPHGGEIDQVLRMTEILLGNL